MTSEKRFVPKHIQTILAGGIAGMISKSCTAPLERIQMLNQTGAAHTSIFGTMKRIYNTDKITGFWKGNFTNCVRIFPHRAILFSVNDWLKSHINTKASSISFLTGSVATTATYPIDLMRAHLAGTFDKNNTSIRRVIVSIYKNHGLIGYYYGLSVTLLGAFPYESIKIGTYSVLRTYVPTSTNGKPHPLGKFVAGAIAGAVSATVCYPNDTIRRMMQVQGTDGLPLFNGLIDCVVSTYKKSGVKRFYRGLSSKLVRVIPDAAILFVSYEFMKDYFEQVFRSS